VIRSSRKLTEAQECYTRAIALLLPLSEKFPEQPDYRHELDVVQNNLGNLLSSQQRFEEARAVHRNSLERFQALAADFPRVPVYRQELANTWNSIGRACAGDDQWTETVNAWNQAASLLEGLVAERDDVAAYQGDLGMVLGNLALVHLAQSQSLEARSHLERAVDRLNKALAVNRDHAVYRGILRDNYQNLAEVLIQCQDHAAAASAARALAGVFPDSAMDCYFAACFLARCEQLVLNDEQHDSSSRDSLPRSYADESVAMLRQAIGKGFADVPRIENDRETVLQAVAGRPDFQGLAQELAARLGSPAQ
jgi:tetratricopeptide (TPR) repeat protein